MEYLRIVPSEKTYAEKNLLYSQMEILNILKRYQQFLKLRKKEFALKNKLKTAISAVKTEMKNLDSFLPKDHYKKMEKEKVERKNNKKRQSIEDEIDEIKQKLASLRQ